MGQVLGFSHCRESAFVLLFPSHCTIVIYISRYIPAQHLFLLAPVSIVCVSSAPLSLPSLPSLHSSLLPLINTWLNGWMCCRGILLSLPHIDLQMFVLGFAGQACVRMLFISSLKASLVLSCVLFYLFPYPSIYPYSL